MYFAAASFTYTLFFFFIDTATTVIYTLSLHDALPISPAASRSRAFQTTVPEPLRSPLCQPFRDRKSTRLNSSHLGISYAVFFLKKKKPIPLADDDLAAAAEERLGVGGLPLEEHLRVRV